MLITEGDIFMVNGGGNCWVTVRWLLDLAKSYIFLNNMI